MMLPHQCRGEPTSNLTFWPAARPALIAQSGAPDHWLANIDRIRACPSGAVCRYPLI